MLVTQVCYSKISRCSQDAFESIGALQSDRDVSRHDEAIEAESSSQRNDNAEQISRRRYGYARGRNSTYTTCWETLGELSESTCSERADGNDRVLHLDGVEGIA